MFIGEIKKRGLFSTTIDLGKALDGEEENPLLDQSVTLRELNTDEQIELERTEETNRSQFFREKLPSLIVGHSFEREAGKKASSDEVADLIESSGSVFVYVLGAWADSLPLAKRSAQSSEKPPISSSGTK